MAQDKILEILKKEKLQLIERGFFRDKQGVARVENEKIGFRINQENN